MGGTFLKKTSCLGHGDEQTDKGSKSDILWGRNKYFYLSAHSYETQHTYTFYNVASNDFVHMRIKTVNSSFFATLQLWTQLDLPRQLTQEAVMGQWLDIWRSSS